MLSVASFQHKEGGAIRWQAQVTMELDWDAGSLNLIKRMEL